MITLRDLCTVEEVYYITFFPVGEVGAYALFS